MDGTKKLSSLITIAQPRGRPQFEGSDILSATDPILPAAYSGYCNIDGVDPYGAKINLRGKWVSGSLSIVVADDPSEHVSITNWTLCRHGFQSKRTILIDTLMRPSGIVISDVLGQNAVQMALVENNQAIQAFFPDRPHPAFGYRIGIGGFKRDVDNLNAFRLKHGVE